MDHLQPGGRQSGNRRKRRRRWWRWWRVGARDGSKDWRVVVSAARIFARLVAQRELHSNIGTSVDAQVDGLGVSVRARRNPTDAATVIVRADIPDAARTARHALLAALHGDLCACIRRRLREGREDLLLLIPRLEARERFAVFSIDHLQPGGRQSGNRRRGWRRR